MYTRDEGRLWIGFETRENKLWHEYQTWHIERLSMARYVVQRSKEKKNKHQNNERERERESLIIMVSYILKSKNNWKLLRMIMQLPY